MALGARVAQRLWLAAGRGAARRFHAALTQPQVAQDVVLGNLLLQHADTAFGREHHLAGVTTWAEFTRTVPIRTWDEHAPWIERIRRGEPQVLTADPVTHLIPTSGSTGARKLIPATRALTGAFDAALAPWLHDLARQRPDMRDGPSYWAITPPVAATTASDDAGVVPIGFEDDAAYLGAVSAWLLRRALAVPSSVRHAADMSSFQSLTMLALLRSESLRCLSIWHPSFLMLLVEAAQRAWPELLDAVADGTCPWRDALPASARAEWTARPMPARAAALRRIGPEAWTHWWPQLAVVSCWGDQAATPGWQALQRALPGVLVQPKGLLATEGVITIPIGTQHPLAITSHVLEFLHPDGETRRPHQLRVGDTGEVVVTNGAGLWRYRLGDVVEVTAHLGETPCVRFVGRAGVVSDLRGEKLTEAMLGDALAGLWSAFDPAPPARVRAAAGGVAGYELLVDATAGHDPARCAALVEDRLLANPHYAIARRLGQLAPLRGVAVADLAEMDELARDQPRRLGEIKPSLWAPAP